MKTLKRDVEDLERFEQIVKITSRQGFGLLLDRINLVHTNKNNVPGPERLRETIERLGPTFIKFGQIMAERPDIIPKEYTEELQKLQDSAPPFDLEEARSIIDEEVGLDRFRNVEEEPLAAASIAQVHRATLENGDDVVVKVRRPRIKPEMEKDLDILLYLSKKAEKHSDRLGSVRIHRIAEEFANWTRNELNLEREAQNAQIFRNNLESEEDIDVPRVYPELTTEKVLVMEYVDGVKCTDAEKLEEYGIDSEDLARTAIKAGMKQVVSDGFFHADPHPSNFLVQKDGTFTYLDFGMMGEIQKDLRDKIALILLYALDEDADKVLQVLTEVGYTEEDADLERIEEIINHKIIKLRNSTISQTSISRELLDLIVKSGRNGLHLPTSMTLMGKNLLTVEGIGLTICPDFAPTEEYERLGKKLLAENNKPEQLFQEAMLDVFENKDFLTSPITNIKNSMQSNSSNRIKPNIENSIEFETLPAVLILSSTALIAGSILEPQLLYIGLAELAAGIILHLK